MSVFGDLLGAVTAPPVGRNRRISSNEQPNWSDGNFDMTRLAPGESFELPVLKGPGVINHIWMTSHAGGVGELNALSLRIYWDGRDKPGVEAPLAEFFAVGQGRPAVVESLPVQVSPTGSLTCYWRMPFATSARIVVTNDNLDRSSGLYWQVDWVELPELPQDTGYFHAQYRQEYPAAPGCDYLIADIEGRGQYVGTVMSVAMAQDGWFGEGDDFFYIDGEKVPSLQGTGSEDYFNDAWGFRTRCSTWFGQPRWQGYESGDEGVCYRWHLADPVGFEKSLKVTIEHKGNRAESEDAWYVERPDFLNSVAFWYQIGDPIRFAELPPWPDRCVPWERHHLVRAFQATRVIGSVHPAVRTVGFFGGRPALVWPNNQAEAALTIPFAVAESGRYALRLTAWSGPDEGHFAVEIDGSTAVAEASFQAADYDETDLLLGVHELEAGVHALAFRAIRGHVGSLSVEMLRCLRLPPEAGRDRKTHNEAHFFRLAIGRAAYAYRLAYDTVPPSLHALVDAGLMPERYLVDENGYALSSTLEPDALVVTSTAPDGWSFRVQGLDARR